MIRAIPTFTLIVVLVSVAAGIGLRLTHPGDIEYKADERYTFEHTESVLNGGAWPDVGMPMSVGPPNPGMSVWVFVALGRVGGHRTPPELARAVQWLNILALVAFIAFAVAAVPRAQAEPWLWAAALWAVNPLSIMLERKIWAQSVLPIFTVAVIAAWSYRRRWIGSFLFAVAVVLAGQIHMTGWLFGAGVAVWTTIGDRRSFRWSAVAAGALVAAIPAASWFVTVVQTGTTLDIWRLPLTYFYKHWLLNAFGFGASFTLGATEFARFLRWPMAGAQSTFLVMALYAAIGLIAAWLVFAAWRQRGVQRPSTRGVLFGSTDASQLVHASFWGFGLILTLLTVRGANVYAHYLEVIAPVLALWVALLVSYSQGGALRQSGRWLLGALCVCQMLIAFMLLSYVHTVGDIQGEFGQSWAFQQRAASTPGK